VNRVEVPRHVYEVLGAQIPADDVAELGVELNDDSSVSVRHAGPPLSPAEL